MAYFNVVLSIRANEELGINPNQESSTCSVVYCRYTTRVHAEYRSGLNDTSSYLLSLFVIAIPEGSFHF